MPYSTTLLDISWFHFSLTANCVDVPWKISVFIFESGTSLHLLCTCFLPVQLGFGVPRATEAAAHAAHSYIAGLQPGHGLLKLDFSNAFNKVRRDDTFQTVHDELPELYSFVHMCYASARRHVAAHCRRTGVSQIVRTSHAPHRCKLSNQACVDVRQHPGDIRAALSV
jgi:hypothetical protein